MTLQTSGPMSFGDINVELGVARTTARPLGSAAARALAGVASGAIRTAADFRGKSYIVFTPTGGSSAGTATYLDDIASTSASVSISCSQNATWTYSGGGTGSSVSIGSGGVNGIITFYLTTDFNPRTASWSVSGTAGGVTRYWDVYLEVQGFA